MRRRKERGLSSRARVPAVMVLAGFLFMLFGQTGLLRAQQVVSWQCPYCLHHDSASSDADAQAQYESHLKYVCKKYNGGRGSYTGSPRRAMNAREKLIWGVIGGATVGGLTAMLVGYQVNSQGFWMAAGGGALAFTLMGLFMQAVHRGTVNGYRVLDFKLGAQKVGVSILPFGPGGSIQFSW